jgi:LPXTG-site transpeptidase (sortase) family protein
VKRWVRVVVGLALMWGAIGTVGYRWGWQHHASVARSVLVHGADTAAALRSTGSCGTVTPTADGQLAGVLHIARLGVTAPVEAGTENRVLAVAVGHADGTPWPGQDGAAVLLAHDVSYFANIDQLRPGDVIDYRSGCLVRRFTVESRQVVKAGSPVPDTSGPTVVLDTCWPTDALWYTPDRYLVQAVETGITVAGHGHGSQSRGVAGSVPAIPVSSYTTPAPPALAATGLDLSHNQQPMGTMTLRGSPSPTWVQSPAPLGLEAAALAAYFGALHAAATQRSDWWQAVAPGVPVPPALWGATVEGPDASPLQVVITVAGDHPERVQLSTTAPVSGGGAPGRYHLDIGETVHGTTVVITSFVVSNGEMAS